MGFSPNYNVILLVFPVIISVYIRSFCVCFCLIVRSRIELYHAYITYIFSGGTIIVKVFQCRFSDWGFEIRSMKPSFKKGKITGVRETSSFHKYVSHMY
jgi:hypothetical protein